MYMDSRVKDCSISVVILTLFDRRIVGKFAAVNDSMQTHTL